MGWVKENLTLNPSIPLSDVLALRKSSGIIEGEVCLNGHPQEEQSFRRCTGYVEQYVVILLVAST